jgi:hypothetical protein
MTDKRKTPVVKSSESSMKFVVSKRTSPKNVDLRDVKKTVPSEPIIKIISAFDEGMEIEVSHNIRKVWSKNGINDPAIAFHWKSELSNGVNHLNNLAEELRPPLPNWFPPAIEYPLNPNQIKDLILTFCIDGTTNGGIFDSFCIAPNSLAESTRILTKLSYLNSTEFFKSLANQCGTPLASLHLFPDSKLHQVSIPVYLPRLPDLNPGDIQCFI